jgi:CBS-domain-containing membrane protein
MPPRDSAATLLTGADRARIDLGEVLDAGREHLDGLVCGVAYHAIRRRIRTENAA